MARFKNPKNIKYDFNDLRPMKIGKAPAENFGVNLGGAMKNIAPLLTHFLKNAGPLFPKKKKGITKRKIKLAAA